MHGFSSLFNKQTATCAQSWKSRCDSTPSILFTKILSLSLSFPSHLALLLATHLLPRLLKFLQNFSLITIPRNEENSSSSPSARINKIRCLLLLLYRSNGAKILSFFLSLNYLSIDEERWGKVNEDTSCDPFGESLVRTRQGLDISKGTRGLPRKWTTVKGAKINPVNIRDKALSPKRAAREEIQERTSTSHDSIVPRLKAVEKKKEKRKEKWRREIESRNEKFLLEEREREKESIVVHVKFKIW